MIFLFFNSSFKFVSNKFRSDKLNKKINELKYSKFGNNSLK